MNIKRTIHHDQVEFIPGTQVCLHIHQTKDIMLHIIRMTGNNHIIISIDAEKAFNKI